jgi:hypothetical protein
MTGWKLAIGILLIFIGLLIIALYIYNKGFKEVIYQVLLLASINIIITSGSLLIKNSINH